MKFYYNGNLVRTSKTHEYKFALLNTETGKAYACSKDMKGMDRALSEVSQTYNLYLSVKNGTYRRKDRWARTAEQLEAGAVKYWGSLDNALTELKQDVDKYKIVELEARA